MALSAFNGYCYATESLAALAELSHPVEWSQGNIVWTKLSYNPTTKIMTYGYKAYNATVTNFTVNPGFVRNYPVCTVEGPLANSMDKYLGFDAETMSVIVGETLLIFILGLSLGSVYKVMTKD